LSLLRARTMGPYGVVLLALLRGVRAVDVVGWFVPGQSPEHSPSPSQLDWDVRVPHDALR
jgi:hypothetical protein